MGSEAINLCCSTVAFISYSKLDGHASVCLTRHWGPAPCVLLQIVESTWTSTCLVFIIHRDAHFTDGFCDLLVLSRIDQDHHES